jgi:ferritin-like metal-binding protein YciE
MKSDILEELLQQELRSLYSTEKQWIKTLTKMVQAACHPKLQAVLNARLEDSGEQKGRLEHIARLLGKSLDGPSCEGLQQLVEGEARESLLNADARNETYDAGLISAARHFICDEVARYELATMLASRLGLDEVERLLHQNLGKQKALDARLTRLAKAGVKRRAVKAARPKRATAPHQGTFIAGMCLMGRRGFGLPGVSFGTEP